MQLYPQKNKGFVIDYDLAEAIEEKFGVEPERVRHFEYARGGAIQSLQGFDYDATYVLFDEYTERSSPAEWENLVSILEEEDVDIVEGTWAEIG